MKSTNRTLGTLVMALTIGLLGVNAFGDATIFLSSSTTLDGNVEANANPTLTLVEGDSQTVGIFVRLDAEAINGMDISLIETSGLLTASAVNIVDNVVGSIPPQGFRRWNEILTPNLNSDPNTLFTRHNTIGGLNGYAGLSGGFLANFDENFSGTEAGGATFLLSTFDITGGDVGSTDLHLQVGGQRIGYAPGNTTDVTFGLGHGASDRTIDGATDGTPDATVNVIPIPEPATLALLGLAGLVGLRRRR